MCTWLQSRYLGTKTLTYVGLGPRTSRLYVVITTVNKSMLPLSWELWLRPYHKCSWYVVGKLRDVSRRQKRKRRKRKRKRRRKKKKEKNRIQKKEPTSKKLEQLAGWVQVAVQLGRYIHTVQGNYVVPCHWTRKGSGRFLIDWYHGQWTSMNPSADWPGFCRRHHLSGLVRIYWQRKECHWFILFSPHSPAKGSNTNTSIHV